MTLKFIKMVQQETAIYVVSSYFGNMFTQAFNTDACCFVIFHLNSEHIWQTAKHRS